MKTCCKCRQDKPEADFGKDKNAKDGLKYRCKKCENSRPKKPRKKIEFTCEACGKTKEVDYYSHKKKKTNFCLNCIAKETQTGIKKPHISGENSVRWKGGEYISSDGYKLVKCDGEYTKSGRQVYKRQHVLVMEDHIGRRLKTQQGRNGEQVHHIDGDKLNNEIDNLLLCKDTKHHKDVDCQLHELAFELVRKGIITFNKETEEYKIEWDSLKTQ